MTTDLDAPTLTAARRELRADLLDRRAVERCAELAADMGLTADAEVFARALSALPLTRTALGRRALPAGMLGLVEGQLLVDQRPIARVYRVGQEGVVVERLAGYEALPDALLAAALAGAVVDAAAEGAHDEIPPAGIAFLDSDRLFWSRGLDDWHVDARANADAIVSAARFFPDDDTRALLVRVIEKEPGDRIAYAWLKDLVTVDVASGRYRSALRPLQLLHRRDPGDADVLELIARSFEAAGAPDRAAEIRTRRAAR